MRRVTKIHVERSCKSCPTCEYTEGFHMVFSRSSEKAPQFRAYLLCPMCSSVFDIGLQIPADGGQP